MLNHNQREIGAIMHNGSPMQLVMHLGKVVWQSVRSCFGAGYWDDDKPWLDDEAWKD